jgi:hypothetical protein
MSILAIQKDRPQGHRRLRFSSPLNNVKEQNPIPPGDKKRTSNAPASLAGPPGLEAFPAAPSGAAVDDAYLGQPRIRVNSNRKDF